MLMSMTGFGKATVEVTNKRINIEIKSLNSKQMDLNVRVPHIFRQEELPLRSYATGILERGKADISVTIENTGSDIQAATTVNTSAMAAYKKQIEQTSAELGIAVPSDWYSVLMRFPDVLSNDNVAEADETEKEALMTCARNAIEQLMLHRRAEGAKLEELVKKEEDLVYKTIRIWLFIRSRSYDKARFAQILSNGIEENQDSFIVPEYIKKAIYAVTREED